MQHFSYTVYGKININNIYYGEEDAHVPTIVSRKPQTHKIDRAW